MEQTNLEKLIYRIAKQAPEQKELWYFDARARKDNTMVHVQADANTIFAEPGLRRAYIGFHRFGCANCMNEYSICEHSPSHSDPWQEASSLFFSISHKYSNHHALDADVYIGHPETNNGLTVEVKPRDLLFLTLHTQQANQIIGGRGSHIGHWKSGAKLHEMPESAIEFTGSVLDTLGIPYKKGAGYVQAQYIQKPTTRTAHLRQLYSNATHEGREISISMQFTEEKKTSFSYNRLGRAYILSDQGHAFFGVGFGYHGNSSWDKVPELPREKIELIDSVMGKMTGSSLESASWEIIHSCNGRDRGKKRSDEFRKGLSFFWRLIW